MTIPDGQYMEHGALFCTPWLIAVVVTSNLEKEHLAQI